MTAGHAGDFARRVAHRREQLGLSREEIARRSGMDSGYLEYLERSAAVGGTVSFEVDHIDEAMSQGWSVLVTGRARRVKEPSELEQLAQLGIDPWAGGSSEAVIRIETIEISGRNIRQRD